MAESNIMHPSNIPLTKSVNTILKNIPPPVLYHYTSRAGLLGILEKRAVYASHVRYLNDASEIAIASRLAQTEILKRLAAVTVEEEKRLYEEIKTWLWSLESQTHVFVFSMTQNGDLLSQWRAYCKPNNGYAIGFESKKLMSYIMSQFRFFLAPCEYKENAQTMIISGLINDINEIFQKLRETGASVDDALKLATANFILSFLVIAPVLKDAAFYEEQEWRLISWIDYGSLGDPRVLYRDGRSLLIPYVVIPLSPQSAQLPIYEVVIGPTSHKEIEATAVMGNLIKTNATGHIVKFSKVPFRGSDVY